MLPLASTPQQLTVHATPLILNQGQVAGENGTSDVSCF